MLCEVCWNIVDRGSYRVISGRVGLIISCIVGVVGFGGVFLMSRFIWRFLEDGLGVF